MKEAEKVMRKILGPITVASMFRAYKTSNDMTLEEMAEILGTTKGFISNVLTGKKKLSLKKTLEIAKKLGEFKEVYASVWFEEEAREAGLDFNKVIKSRVAG